MVVGGGSTLLLTLLKRLGVGGDVLDAEVDAAQRGVLQALGQMPGKGHGGRAGEERRVAGQGRVIGAGVQGLPQQGPCTADTRERPDGDVRRCTLEGNRRLQGQPLASGDCTRKDGDGPCKVIRGVQCQTGTENLKHSDKRDRQMRTSRR